MISVTVFPFPYCFANFGLLFAMDQNLDMIEEFSEFIYEIV